MNKKETISAIRKAIREKNLTLACKLIPAKEINKKEEWIKENISYKRYATFHQMLLIIRMKKDLNVLRWMKDLPSIKGKFYNPNDGINTAFHMLRRLIKENLSPYTKIAMYGFTHLYFCSPIYGHKDYNKVKCCKIDGNENLCAKIFNLSEKIYNKKKEKA